MSTKMIVMILLAIVALAIWWFALDDLTKASFAELLSGGLTGGEHEDEDFEQRALNEANLKEVIRRYNEMGNIHVCPHCNSKNTYLAATHYMLHGQRLMIKLICKNCGMSSDLSIDTTLE